MSLNNKEKIHALLKSIETGNTEAVSVVNEEVYIQHNPQTHEGSEGLATLFKRLSKISPRVNLVRTFEDGDFVFAHTEYDFSNRNIGFEIFRFENGQAVEHWDNIQKRQKPNASGHTMIDGETEAKDHNKTEVNRTLISSFIEDILIKGNHHNVAKYINKEQYTEHNPHLADDMVDLLSLMSAPENRGLALTNYNKCHHLLAEGNFVLSVCEGDINQTPSSFFDLYRIEADKIVEHWDTTESIPPKGEWKNSNGKF